MQVVAQGTVENSKDDLNALCLMFCVTVEEHIFFNGQDWIAECTAFCKTLCETLTFMPNDTLLCEEIKAFLLNPQDNPSDSCNDQVAEILQILRSQMRQHSSASGFSGQCAVCSGASGSGIWTRCAGRGCLRVFHVRCASSKLLSKKHSSIYYRCEICTAREIEITVDGRERKRQKISRDDGRISCETSGGLAEFSASVRAAAASSASDASTAAGCKCPEVLAALHAVPASDTASAAASSPATAATLNTSRFVDNVSAAETDVLAESSASLTAAAFRGELSIVQDEILSTIQVIRQAAHSKVSLENAALLKQVLFKISSEVKQLRPLASYRSQFPISVTASRVNVGISVGRQELVRVRDSRLSKEGSSDMIDESEIVQPCGISNRTGTLCCYICLVQAWFHVKSFRKAVFDASCDCASDSFIFYLSSIFHSLQTGKQVDLKVLLRHYFLRSLM